jgi:two-component system NtrC family sensor kinase
MTHTKAHSFFVIICIHCFCLASQGQNSKIDSLKKILPSFSGIPKADLLNQIGKEYRYPNPDSATRFAKEANDLSQKLGYTRGIAESYRILGWVEKIQHKQNEYYYLALSRFISIHDIKGIADTYNNLGTLWMEKNDSISLACYDSSLIMYQIIGDKKGESAILNFIGIVYQKLGNYQKAIDFTLKGLDIRKTTNDHPGVVWSFINAGNIYFAGGQLESALNLYLQSVTYAKDHGMEPYDASLIGMGKTYLQMKQYKMAETYLLGPSNGKDKPYVDPILLGQLYLETNRADSALIQYKKSLKHAGNDNNREVIAASLIGLSRVFAKEKKRVLAMNYAEQAFTISDSLKDKFFHADAARMLAPYYEMKGDYKKSLQLYKLAHSILDSISNETNENYQHKLAVFESKSQIENEQAHVKLLSAEKALQDQKLKDEKLTKEFILIGSGIILFVSFITIRNINGKRKKIQSQKDLIDLQKASVEKAYEELKLTQSQLIQREKMASLGELMAGIAHEIQNPLNFVNNFSEINTELIDEMENEIKTGNIIEIKKIADDIKTYMAKITNHGKRADSIVKAMLQHSKASTGIKEPTDINELAEEYLSLSYHGLSSKDKSFIPQVKTNFDDAIGKIPIVSQDIGRVLLNLYNNAFYAVTDKRNQKGETYSPLVTVSTKKLTDKIEIRVRDNGMGIPEKTIDKIFQPFFTTKPTGQGTGLGLSLSYDIIKSHGGEIKTETKEGEFTEFIIRIPV